MITIIINKKKHNIKCSTQLKDLKNYNYMNMMIRIKKNKNS